VLHNAGAVFKGSAMDGGKALDKRVLCEQNPKQELYTEVQFLPASLYRFLPPYTISGLLPGLIKAEVHGSNSAVRFSVEFV